MRTRPASPDARPEARPREVEERLVGIGDLLLELYADGNGSPSWCSNRDRLREEVLAALGWRIHRPSLAGWSAGLTGRWVRRYTAGLLYQEQDYELKPGEQLVTSCTFDNTNTFGVPFGESSDTEMCYQFTFHYPAHAMANGAPITIASATQVPATSETSNIRWSA